jgi:YfiH family protein
MNVPVVRSELLSTFPELRHGFSTRNGGVSKGAFGMNLSYSVGDVRTDVDENRRLFFSAIGVAVESVAYPGQIHSALVHVAGSPGRYASCDALVTERTDLFLAVSVADCMPILLYDPVRRVVAAVHSGWRGSEGRILTAVLDVMKREYHSLPADIVASIGPSAGPCCYEVGEEVAMKFGEKHLQRQAQWPKPHLDLRTYNRGLLTASGVREHNIEISSLCTICSPGTMHSYRRDGGHSGRMMAGLGLSPHGTSGV